VSVRNFKVDKSENVDNASTFLRFFDMTLQKTLKVAFLDFEKNVKKYFRTMTYIIHTYICLLKSDNRQQRTALTAANLEEI